MRGRQRVRLVVAAGAVAALVAGCGQAADQLEGAAQDLVDRAASEATDRLEAAGRELGDQARQQLEDAVGEWDGEIAVDGVCDVVRDRELTDAERQSLDTVTDYGRDLGLPDDLVDGVGTVLDGDNLEEQLDRMAALCDDLGAVEIPLPTST